MSRCRRSLIPFGPASRGLALLALAVFGPVPAVASAASISAACSGTKGDGASLAGAITLANSDPGTDTVVLGAGCTYTLTSVNNYWYGPNGLPAISSDVTIEGNGATITRSPFAPDFRLFFVGADPASPDTLGYASPGPGRLTLRDVTLSGGIAQGGGSDRGGGGAGMGGAIFSQGFVAIDHSTVTGNLAQGGASTEMSVAGGSGGGIGTGAGTNGGGFGTGSFGGGAGGSGGGDTTGGGGGGGGFATTEGGGAATQSSPPGQGGGPQTGLGGAGGAPTGVNTSGGAPGDGAGGGGGGGIVTGSPTNFAAGGAGGAFGEGGAY
ncbi:MAG: hypothetical protein ACYC0H_15155, partial [Solirubrobacteraceae bacterium]